MAAVSATVNFPGTTCARLPRHDVKKCFSTASGAGRVTRQPTRVCGGMSVTVRASGASSSSVEEGDNRRAPAAVAAAAAAIVAASAVPMPALSADTQTVAEFNASGLVFKDSVEVVALTDPVVDGVTLYLSDFKRSISAKMKSSDFFSEPTQSSLACVRTEGGVRVKGDLGGREGAEMFAERKNLNLLNNKTLRVRRIYHPEADTLIYVAYSTRTASTGNNADGSPSAGQYKTSICAVPLKAGEASPAPAAAAAAQ